MTIRPLFAWYDFWIGVYWDRNARRLYLLPFPMVGVVIEFRSDDPDDMILGPREMIDETAERRDHGS